ncbi:MAG: hypothetical protein ACW99Q_13835, partial [Candidatus Kariarchaeaceae archaeon]
PHTRESEYYYTLLNGTEIFFEESTGTTVYSLQFNTTGDLTYLNNTQINTFYKYATFESSIWNGSAYIYTYTFPIIDGSTLVITTDQEIQRDLWYHPITNEETYNTTLYFEFNSTSFTLDNPGYFLNLYQFIDGVLEKTQQLEVQDKRPQWDWHTGFYFVINKASGERYYFYENSTYDGTPQCGAYYCLDAAYLIDIDGTTYVVAEGPWNIEQIYTTTQPSFGTINVTERFTRQIFHIEGSPNLLLPTSTLPAQYYWDLGSTITQGGLVPTLKSVEIDREKVLVKRLTSNWELEFTGNGSTRLIPLDSVNTGPFLFIINATNYWNLSLTGYSIKYGKYSSGYSNIADIQGSINVKTRYDLGYYEPDFIEINYQYVLNSTDLSRIGFVEKPVGSIFEINVNNTVLVNTTTYYSLWDGSSYYFIGLNNEKYIVEPSNNYTLQNTYLYYGSLTSQGWMFDFDGIQISLDTWIEKGYQDTWLTMVDLGGTEYAIISWTNETSELTLYNFSYGIYDGIQINKIGWFTADTQNGWGNLFWEPYYLLFNHTTNEEIRVNNSLVISLWKIRLNGSAIVYTPYHWFFEPIEDPETSDILYYEVLSYNGSVYFFQGLRDFEFLGEYHFYPSGDYPNELFYLDGNLVNASDPNNYIHLSHQYTILIDGQIVELDRSERWTPLFTIYYQGQDRTISFKDEPILRRISHYGYPIGEMYGHDESIFTESSVWSIVVGNPRSNMWGFDVWTVNPDNGALDIDGDLTTPSDQFYVRRVWETTNNYTDQYSRLNVNLYWDPDTSTFDNEYKLNGWMGYSTTTYTWDWSETYIWYYAENMTHISGTTLDDLQAILFDGNEPAPGYWMVAQMLENRSWADMVAEALENGWDWIESNTETYTWLDFGFNQSYFTFTTEGGSTNWIFNELETSWSGLWIYDDMNEDGIADFGSDEISHTFIPNSVGQLVFTTPGIAFGDTSASGIIDLADDDPDFNTTVDFGVQFLDVNGTTYPVIRDVFGDYGSYWDWHSTGIAGSDYNGFANRPAEVSIDEIAFQLHFDIETIPGEDNAKANLKLDQTVGNWDVDMIGGRRNLENYSLAISYFVNLQTASVTFTVRDHFRNPVSNQEVISSDSFSFGTDTGFDFAQAILEGEYVWAKNTSLTINSTSYTMPISQFETVYQSDDGRVSVGFTIKEEMYFLAIGFPLWDGFRVFQDPTYAAYSAVSGSVVSSFAPMILESPAQNNIQADIGVVLELSWIAQDTDPTTYEIYKNGALYSSESWVGGFPVLLSV